MSDLDKVKGEYKSQWSGVGGRKIFNIKILRLSCLLVQSFSADYNIAMAPSSLYSSSLFAFLNLCQFLL